MAISSIQMPWSVHDHLLSVLMQQVKEESPKYPHILESDKSSWLSHLQKLLAPFF